MAVCVDEEDAEESEGAGEGDLEGAAYEDVDEAGSAATAACTREADAASARKCRKDSTSC